MQSVPLRLNNGNKRILDISVNELWHKENDLPRLYENVRLSVSELPFHRNFFILLLLPLLSQAVAEALQMRVIQDHKAADRNENNATGSMLQATWLGKGLQSVAFHRYLTW